MFPLKNLARKGLMTAIYKEALVHLEAQVISPGGCWWPGANLEPGQFQQSWWHMAVTRRLLSIFQNVYIL